MPSPLALPSPSLYQRFQDVDAFGQASYNNALSLTQLDTGCFDGSVLKLQLDGMQLVRVTMSCSLYTLGPKPLNKFTFSISLSGSKRAFISHKQALPPQALFGFDASRDVNLITPEHLQMAIVTVPIERFQQYLHDVERDDLDAKFFQQNTIQIEDQRFGELRDYLNQIFYLAIHQSDFLARSHRLIASDLLPLLINCFSPDVCPRFCAHPFRRATLVQEAEDYMRDHLDEPITLEAICTAVKTSKSALSYGFKDIFGLSPMAYLKTVRLNGVRRALKASDPTQATVLGIANRYGFWHMGHFSRDYRQMFGESPSNTLRNGWL